MSKLTNAQNSGLQNVMAGIIGAGILFICLAGNSVRESDLQSLVNTDSEYNEISYEDLNEITKEIHELSELTALSMTIHCEAKGESYMGKKMVGEVIRNRVNSKRYKNTYKEVVYQPYQFSCWNKGNKSGIATMKDFDSSNPSKSVLMSIAAAKEVINGNSNVLPRKTMYYHVATMKKYPSWAGSKKLRKVETIGSHSFYLRP